MRAQRTITSIMTDRRPAVADGRAYQMRGTRQPQFSHDILLNQDPDLPDYLRRVAMARSVAALIRGEQSPHVVGIYGSWGAGKSYLLSLIINELFSQNTANSKKVVVCAFQPWRYEVEGDLALGLIKALRGVNEQYSGRNPPLANITSIRRRATALFETIASVLIYSNQIKLALTGATMKALIKNLESDDDVQRIARQMQQLADEILMAAHQTSPRDEWQLVVFIDDLDRCSPENMVSMFEWLKVHLNVPNITYVLALDHVAAAHAIRGSYEQYLGEEKEVAYGFRYLEKLVDYEYELEDATQVENMAIRQSYDESTRYRTFADIANDLYGGDFPGIQNVGDLVNLRSLRVPRTMLKIVGKFDTTMRAIREAGPEVSGKLPASYPFWALFLICVYYRLDPTTLADFVDGRSALYQLLASTSTGSQPTISDEFSSGAMREFWQYAERLKEYAGAGLQVPNSRVLQSLAAAIRENIVIAPTSSRF